MGEERRRLGFKQAEFSPMVGTDVPKQSLYENDRRQLRADYLERLHKAGVDIRYVLTGNRTDGGLLDEASTALLATYFAMPEKVRESIRQLIEDFGEQVGEARQPLEGERPDE